MKIRWEADPALTEPELLLRGAELTPELEDLLRRLERELPAPLMGFDGDRVVPLDPGAVLRFYGEDKAVLAQTAEGSFAVKLRLYELEERLDRHTFVRISQSEIVNLRKVAALDLTLSGTIKMTLTGGTACYASRRYVKKIKEALGL